MNKPTLIVFTILSLLFMGTWIYTSEHGKGRYVPIPVPEDAVGWYLLDTKNGLIYSYFYNRRLGKFNAVRIDAIYKDTRLVTVTKVQDEIMSKDEKKDKTE